MRNAGARAADWDRLDVYLRSIRAFPMLTAEEEAALARRWVEHGDLDAAHQLVNSHLRLAAKIAMGYQGYGLPLSELVSEGNVGLMQAVQRFDPGRGFRLATYAMWWIRAAIQEYILRSWSLVRLGTTAQQKKLFFNLRRLKSRLQILDGGDLTPEQLENIAVSLNVSEADVEMMDGRLSGPDRSLNVPLREENGGEWQDWLVDEDESHEVRYARAEEYGHRKRFLDTALKTLSDRERHIIVERRLREDPLTLEQLARQFGISRERVRQIESSAIEKLKGRSAPFLDALRPN